MTAAEAAIPREAAPCDLCGADDAQPLFRVRGSRHGLYVDGAFVPLAGGEPVVRCRRCGLVYVSPRLAEAPGNDAPGTRITATYTAEEERAYFEATRPARAAGNERLLDLLEGSLGGRGRLLDVGCGDGLLLEQAERRGWEARGLEVSGELLAGLRARHGAERIIGGPLPRAALPAGSFDAVALINVIEHLRRPSETVAAIAGVLRPGGVVAVHTVNAASLSARLRRSAWHHFEPFDHFHYFTAATLAAMLEGSGLAVSGRFALGGAPWKQRLLEATHRLGLALDNGLGLLARAHAKTASRKDAKGRRRKGNDGTLIRR